MMLNLLLTLRGLSNTRIVIHYIMGNRAVTLQVKIPENTSEILYELLVE